MEVTIRELRALLFEADEQDMTVAQLRSALFERPEQDAPITPAKISAMTKVHTMNLKAAAERDANDSCSMKKVSTLNCRCTVIPITV